MRNRLRMRITWLFALVALAGCGKKGSEAKGDCGVSVENAVKVSTEVLKSSGFSDATIVKIREASLVRCKEDKWSNDVLKCLTAAKKSDDIKNCNNMMTKEQRDNMDKALAAMAADAGSGSATPEQGSGGSGSATPEAPGSGSAPAAASGLPEACASYTALIEKMAACKNLPEAARTTIKNTYDATSKSWANFEKLDAAGKKTVETACASGVDALKKSAGAVCGL